MPQPGRPVRAFATLRLPTGQTVVAHPNAPLRAALTALALETAAAQPTPPVETIGEEPAETPHRSATRYLWAMLRAGPDARFPLTCPHCWTVMPMVAFITEKAPVPRVLNPIGEPSMAPRIALRVELRRGRATNLGPLSR